MQDQSRACLHLPPGKTMTQITKIKTLVDSFNQAVDTKILAGGLPTGQYPAFSEHLDDLWHELAQTAEERIALTEARSRKMIEIVSRLPDLAQNPAVSTDFYKLLFALDVKTKSQDIIQLPKTGLSLIFSKILGMPKTYHSLLYVSDDVIQSYQHTVRKLVDMSAKTTDQAVKDHILNQALCLGVSVKSFRDMNEFRHLMNG